MLEEVADSLPARSPNSSGSSALLDEAFAGIATAKANAEKNLQNARALFESHLQSVFTQRGKGWVEKRLADVAARLTNGYVGPTRNIYGDSGVPLSYSHATLKTIGFSSMGRLSVTDEFNRKNKKSMLQAGDVLLVQSGHIGHSAVVTPEHDRPQLPRNDCDYPCGRCFHWPVPFLVLQFVRHEAEVPRN